MSNDFTFSVDADASTPATTARELIAIKIALGFILAKLPPDAHADIVQSLIKLPAKESKDLSLFLNQFRELNQPD